MAGEDSHDLMKLLGSSDRDFLIRNNGDQVKLDALKEKKVGLYFSASWCGPCQHFTPNLVEAYNELLPKGDFEVVFLTADEDDKSFKEYFSKMPWLAVPFSDSETRKRLDELFAVKGIPHLVILDDSGKVVTDNGVEIILEHGVEGYPFTQERLNELKEQEETAKREQSLKSILESQSRNYVVAADGRKVPVAELEGKIVGLYFSISSFEECESFTRMLIDMYDKLKAQGENFEVVMIPLDGEDGDESFKKEFASMPWYSLPLKDRTCEKLARYFELSTLPTLVIIGTDGKTLHSNVAEAIEEHGILAYPFTPEKFSELEQIEKAKREAQTLESILVTGDHDFVIGKDGEKILVSDLVGKNILLYFSAHWCPPCRAFTPKLKEAYENIKAKSGPLEVIFISSDQDQASFDDYFATMPWLALPFGDERKASLSRLFKVQGIPTLVAIGPSGKTITTGARSMIMRHGAEAFPFTKERMKEIEAEIAEKKENNLDPEVDQKEQGKDEKKPNEGWVCDGEVCSKS
ncbi:putative nucleoredoxin 1 [Nicotiana tabacum]|uniref:protein-disulfide reductase n=2 Tax=Nicotiana TaxID=4085 RepID=A0A1S4CQA3_TOBAC|nr:PREDICTED: probable nucleoredoxin 1 [Nicotiana sylvestris]XP_016503413.1 PREDICTED: probable nucleoredoxin 1 [Nicotiana tabacum]